MQRPKDLYTSATGPLLKDPIPKFFSHWILNPVSEDTLQTAIEIGIKEYTVKFVMLETEISNFWSCCHFSVKQLSLKRESRINLNAHSQEDNSMDGVLLIALWEPAG